MTKRLAGVALAAVMACGWADQAFATSLAFASSYFGGYESRGSVDVKFDTSNHFAQVYVSEGDGYCTNQYGGNCLFVTTIEDQKSYYSLSNIYYMPGGIARSVEFFNPHYVSTTTSYDLDPPVSYQNTGYDFTLNFIFDGVSGVTGFFQDDFSRRGFYLGGQFDFAAVDPSFFSTVPLPSSAPLFGAALLGLGAISYSMKRRSQPQAA